MSNEPLDKQTGALPDPESEEERAQLSEAASETRPEADETTGASPGTAQACEDLGLNSLAANLDRFGIKPPGQS